MARPRGDIAPRIVHAARRRFLGEGVDGASLRAIAADAGTNIGMVYYYYPSKDDLFLAVVEESYAGVLAGIATALDPAASVPIRLERLFARLGALSVDEGEVLRLIIREALASPVRLSQLIARFRRGHVPLMIDLIREGVRDGHLRSDLPPAVLLVATVALAGPAQVLLGLVRGKLGLPESFTGSATAAAPALLEALFHGIGRTGPPPEPRPARRPRSPRRRSGQR
ncbi:MAG TPA: TetR/AcrR family transcriptional regulator [Polyangia bacterium]